MKNNKIRLNSYYLLIISIILLLIGLFFLAYFIVSRTGINIQLMTLAFLLLIIIAIFLNIRQNIYLSVSKLSKRLEKLINIDTESKPFTLKNIFYSNQKYLNSLLKTLEQRISNEYTAHILKTQAEMYALQSQINPHFLYNTLDTIRSYAIQKNASEVAEMTEALAILFRYSISRPNEMATLGEELKNVENYFFIQQYRFQGKFRILKKIEYENEDIMSYKLPILTIQPMIENAIHHGLEPKVGAGTIVLRIFTTQSRLIISISDDGIGIDQDKLDQISKKLLCDDISYNTYDNNGKQKHSGIALCNVNQRIKLYYGKEYGLFVTSTKNVGTTVEIQLPKNY